MNTILSIAQIVVSLLLAGSILLQQRGTALGSAFGGGEAGFEVARRGSERLLFRATIFLSASFLVLAVANLFV